MDDPAQIKVTRIGKRWHCRLTWNGVPIVEIATDRRDCIQWCCREAMRTADKNGYSSPRTSASRHQYDQKRVSRMTGRYWFTLIFGRERKLDGRPGA